MFGCVCCDSSLLSRVVYHHCRVSWATIDVGRNTDCFSIYKLFLRILLVKIWNVYIINLRGNWVGLIYLGASLAGMRPCVHFRSLIGSGAWSECSIHILCRVAKVLDLISRELLSGNCLSLSKINRMVCLLDTSFVVWVAWTWSFVEVKCCVMELQIREFSLISGCKCLFVLRSYVVWVICCATLQSRICVLFGITRYNDCSAIVFWISDDWWSCTFSR